MGQLSLLYHRVNNLQPDPWTLSVSPRHFDEQLSVIKGISPLPSITFDDGYRDNLDFALPLLEKHDLPATVFALGGFLGAPHEMWWDVLARVFLTGEPPFDLDDEQLTDRQEQYRQWFVRLRPLSHLAQQRELESLPFPAPVDETRQLMTGTELAQLAACPLIEIGAHTMTHPVLSLLNPEQQSREIVESKLALEETLGRTLQGFAYPNGTDSDYTDLTVSLVRQAGFRYAYSAFEHSRTDPFQMPRVMVRDWNEDEFARVLRTASQRVNY